MRSIALIHEWFQVYTGSERVVEQILNLYPQAELFSLVDFTPLEGRSFLKGKTVSTSFIQKLPFASRFFRLYLPLMPLAVEQMDLTHYDLIISSSHAFSKGVITAPDQLHISYIHSPIRYAWDMQFEYLQDSGLDRGIKSWLTRLLLHYLRLWDSRSVNGVDAIIANSKFIARRIWRIYRREATVIYPPVDVDSFPFQKEKEDYYITVSRLVPYKKVNQIVRAFAGMPDRKLVVIGSGPELGKIQRSATPNVQVLGHQPHSVIGNHLKKARAFIFAAKEDFGIAPVEAQACGTPVIAYGRGGALETIRGIDQDSPTGLFFDEQTPQCMAKAVMDFEANSSKFQPEACRQNAQRFNISRFLEEFNAFVEKSWEQHHSSKTE
jgi:glycosyltransferase involved in cell wall biosynthesis